MSIVFFANPCGDETREAMRLGKLGFIDTPRQGNLKPAGVLWCADNGCYGKGYPGDQSWLAWLDTRTERELCAFATAPDVVGDAVLTRERSAPFLPRIRQLGYPAAFVAQDGIEDLDVDWDCFDVLFVGGSTEWKLSHAAEGVAGEAKRQGKWVHCGRVNSEKRLRFAAERLGADSADGTYLVFGPSINLPKLLGWLDRVNAA